MKSIILIFSLIVLLFLVAVDSESKMMTLPMLVAASQTSELICESDEVGEKPCVDCSISDLDKVSEFVMVRHNFCVDIRDDRKQDYAIRSMPKKYRGWPEPYYSHALFGWTRHQNGEWEHWIVVGKGVPGASAKHIEVAAEKAKVLMYYLDKHYPSNPEFDEEGNLIKPGNVVAFSYPLFLHDTVIYINPGADLETHKELVKKLNEAQSALE